MHSSSTRKKVDRIFNNGHEGESLLSSRTLTPEHNNDSGIHSQSEKHTDTETNKSSNVKPTLFTTKPRLARSGSKPTTNEKSNHNQDQTNSNVKVVGRGFMDEKKTNEEKFQPINNKAKPKIIKGNSNESDRHVRVDQFSFAHS